MNSRGTRKRIFHQLESKLGAKRNELQGLPIKVKESSGKAPVSLESLTTTAADVAAEESSSVVVDVSDICKTYSSKISSLEKSIAELRAELMVTKNDMAFLKSRVSDLEANSGKYHDIVKRYVVDKVHTYLQQRFGVKKQNISWRHYLETLFSDNNSFFEERGLGSGDMGLMEKGNFTPYQGGNEASHNPSVEAVDRIIESQDVDGWRIWWNLVRDKQ